jgi:transposase-like protein
LTENKVLFAVAIEKDDRRIDRIRLESIPDLKRATLHGFAASAEPGSTVRTDGFAAYLGMDGYVHQRQVQTEQPEAEHILPRVHLVIGLLKRRMLGTHRGAIGDAYLDDHRNEFTFRFNRPHIGFTRQAVLSIGTASCPDRAGSVCKTGQTTTSGSGGGK